MEYKKGLIKISRKQLYDEIWTSSVSGVAKKYDLNYAKLIISCKQANIPFPSSGFWTRKNLGKDISAEIVPLPESNLEYVSVYLNNASMQTSKERAELENSLSNQNSISDIKIDENEEGLYRDILDYLDEAERVMVIAKACSIKIVEGAKLHPVLTKYKTMMEDYRVRLKEAKSKPYYNPRNKPDGEPVFFPDLSENGAKRTIAILNALYKGIEALGGIINDDLSVTIHKDSVRFRFAESKDKLKHELTKKDIQELAKYEADLKNSYRWISMPQIRKYDYVFNGKLRITFGEKNYLRDNEFQRLEDRLGYILIRFYDKSEKNRIERERREEEQRIREAEQRRKEEIRERKNLESQRTKELANKAKDYRIACDIRRFIEDAMKSGKEEFSREWLAWASLKADWYDPIIAAEDKYLGVREHGKSKEKKKWEMRKYGKRRVYFMVVGTRNDYLFLRRNNKQLYDAIFGFAIGDVLGVPYEFQERGSFLCTDLTGYGCHHQPAGTWSDDTSMTLATLKSLKENNGKINIEDIRKRFLSWLQENAFTANGEVFDIGHATYEALTSGKPCVGERSNGNGSLMRILPLAFVECTDEEIRAVSAITHGHWISEEACVIYVHVAKRLLAGGNILDILPTLQYDKPFDRLHRIHQLDSSEIKSSGYVVDTLEAALWAISHVEENEENDEQIGLISKDYANDVLVAVNLGEDTDIVGAVAGGLSAMIHGLGNQGEKWLERLRNKEQILECLW